MGISKEGKSAESEFRRIVSDAKDPDDAASGDAQVEVDGISQHVEVKNCTSTTINQVRAIKVAPLIVRYAPPEMEVCWFVVAGIELVRLACEKKRGQHTEIAFESMTLSTKMLSEWECSEGHLRRAVRAAIKHDREPQYLAVRGAMAMLLADLKHVAESRRDNVRELLDHASTRWEIPK